MPPQNRYRVPPGTHIHKTQQLTPQTPQTRQYNPHNQGQLPPQQMGFRSQHINNPPLWPSFHTTPLTASTSHHGWLPNQHVGQNNHNSLFYHIPVAGSSNLQATFQSLPVHTTGGGFGQPLSDLTDESSGHRYTGFYNHMHSIGPSIPVTGPSPDIRYEGVNIGVRAHDEASPWGILWNSQISTPGNHGEPHSLDGGEPPINPANSQTSDNSPMDPNGFRMLPGYRGCKNNYGLFECFDDCKHSRFGDHGFPRRANLLAHLRNCHGQNIPRGARVNPSL